MKRDDNLLIKRARFVQAQVAQADRAAYKVVEELSDKLFVSTATIYRDLKKKV